MKKCLHLGSVKLGIYGLVLNAAIYPAGQAAVMVSHGGVAAAPATIADIETYRPPGAREVIHRQDLEISSTGIGSIVIATGRSPRD